MNLKLDTPRLWSPPLNGESPFPPPVGRPRYVRDHKDLPFEDPTVAKNLNEHPQAVLLTTSIEPHLIRRHPDGQFAIGQDSYIYFDDTDPPARGAKAPDWFYVPGVSPLLGGEIRRSYVLWRERTAPSIVIEFASGDGSEERDRRAGIGKFWLYEQMVRAEYYAIFDPFHRVLEVFRLVDGRYEPVHANDQGRYSIETMGVELGLWHGQFLNMTITWLRWWDENGDLLPTPEERADRLAAKLRELGVDPDSV